MLKDLLWKDMIELDVAVYSWEEAVRRGGQLLLKAETIKEEYIDAMVDTVKDMGPYMVITKGVAMPHARPEKGALKQGLSFITLKEAVAFGNEEYDPVKLVVCFSSLDDKSHLSLLSSLAELFEDEKAIEKIIHARTKEAVLQIIKKF